MVRPEGHRVENFPNFWYFLDYGDTAVVVGCNGSVI
jgi:hypothetical protein